MANEIENYQDTMQKYERAFAHANHVVLQARKCAAELEDWRNTIISNTGSSYPGSIRRGGPMVNADEWPSIKDIDAALVAYHNAKANMQMAYDAISGSVRSAIKSPASHIAEVEKELGTRYSR